MSLWRQLTRGLRALTHRSAADQEIDDEVQHYLEQATAAYAANGLSQEEALRAARLDLGSVLSVREQVRGSGWENAIETLLADLRYAGRRLRAEPGFTAVTVLTVALGVGAMTAIFSAVSPILFEPLPYPDAGRITMIWEIRSDGSHIDGSFGMYRGLVERARSFDAIAVLKPWQPTMTGPEQPERFEGQRVSASYFQVLGVPPVLGRGFQASDDRLNGPNVVVLGDGLWRRRFGGDRTIIGRQITLDENSYMVIGVMPKGFENVLAPSAELWAPLQYDMSQGRAWGHHLRTVGRLRPGISIDQAAREIDQVGQAVLKEQRPETYGDDVDFIATSLQDDITRGVRPALLAVLGAVILVLVIACVNVTNLLLARGVHRRGELALRAALGAGRGRLIRQLFTESLLLAAMGGVVGMGVAMLGVRALVALSPPGLPRVGAIGVDGAVLAFGLGVTTWTGLAFGLIPALQAARSDPYQDLQHGSRRSAGGHRRARGALVVAEVALALVLLVSSGLLLRSLERLFAVAIGFDSSHLLTMQVQTSGRRFDREDQTYRFFAQALEAVRRVPGVTAAAFTSQLPLSGDLDEYGVHFEASPTRPAQTYNTFRYAVSPGYIETMRIPLRQGRLFSENDRAGAPLVALISESLAKLRFPGADPLGQRLRIGPTDGPPYTIVGVVADVRQMSLAMSQSEAVYIPASQWLFADNVMSFVIRARGDEAVLAPSIRQAIWSVDKDQPIVRVAMMDDLLAASAAERRFVLILFEAFALAALVLATAGIYGVLAGSVAERTREIGVRSALGASRRNILALVIGQGMALTGLGAAIGVAGSAAATQAIVAMLFGVSPLDPVTYLGVISLLAGVAMIACGVPAWRAARVDPASTLRAE
ncbi:MAG TPA: ABC transporter permease [Thermoanaerobaculia bacterium]|jgi:putative ABC transport system permease protein|nr:ABC transporter permease [Thermoanaerobaculia bacterium]